MASRRTRRRGGRGLAALLALCAAGLGGCPLGPDEATDPVPPDDGRQDVDDPPTDWTVVSGPCLGSQTNAMHFDADGRGYLGCGENADGVGLHRSDDGGRSWARVDGFDRVRVSDIRRGPDGALLLAGKDTTGPAIAYAYRDGAAPSVEVLLNYGPRAPFMRIGHAENVVVAADGAAMVDSLTGSYVGYRAAADEDFVEYYYGLDADDAEAALTIRRLGLVDGAFFGVGGSISDPAQVFVEADRPRFTRVALGEHDGELYDFAQVGDAVLVGGWDQTDREPLLLRGVGDLARPESWTRLDVTARVAQGAVRGVHAVGDDVLVVGERFPTAAGGFALFSSDGGEHWADVTPKGARVLSRAWLFSDGRAVVAGAGGYLALGSP